MNGGIKYKLNQKRITNIFITLLIIAVIFVAISLVGGSRLTPDQAVKSTHLLDDTSILLGKVDSSKYKVFVYENADVYRTIFVKYRFPFWVSNESFWANKTQDKVKLVGWCSFKGITVVPIQSFDENVSYIEMGSGIDFQKKEVKKGEVLLFTWNKSVRWNDLNAIAYSSDNKPLYKLGYEIINSTIHADELKWLPID